MSAGVLLPAPADTSAVAFFDPSKRAATPSDRWVATLTHPIGIDDVVACLRLRISLP
jgi:hypothetical protein